MRYQVKDPSGNLHIIEGPDGASPEEVIAAAQKTIPQAPPVASAAAPSAMDQIIGGARDSTLGLVRGAAGIGATLQHYLNPMEWGNDQADKERRQWIEDALDTLGANKNSGSYKGSKLTAEIAGTSGIGGALANGARLVGAGPAVANALTSGGMTTGSKVLPGAVNALKDIAIRTGAGAAVGGASAGLVDPSEAAAGAIVGGAIPAITKVAGSAGNALGSALRGPEQAPELAAAVQAARGKGYVIPPTQANPTLANRALEGFSGKITTAQNASAKNAAVTNGLAAQEIGLAADTPLTPDILKNVRAKAGQAYDAVRKLGDITPTPAYETTLDAITADARKAAASFPNDEAPKLIAKIEALKSPQFSADGAVSKISSLREQADTAYRQGDKALGKGLKSAADALEAQIDAHMVATGAPADLLQNFRDARQTIAKTYSIQSAMNPVSGAIDARKLAGQLQRGKPLSGGLKDAADFAGRFPKANQTIEGMGSLPGTSPLDWLASAGTSMVTGNPLAMLGVGARPLARAATLSPAVQNRLVQGAPSRLPPEFVNALSQGAYRAAPLLGADR